MAERAPMNQVAAVENRNSGEVFEGRGGQIVVMTYAAKGGVGMILGHFLLVDGALCMLEPGNFPDHLEFFFFTGSGQR
jgi:hypothetical protein